MTSCGFLDSMDEVDTWREDRRSGLVCASLGSSGMISVGRDPSRWRVERG